MKKCCHCQKELEKKCFWKNRDHKDGLAAACKSCCFIYNKKYVKEHPEKLQKYRKKWEAKNRKRRILYWKQWCIKNPKKIQACQKKWRKTHLDYDKKRCLVDVQYKLARLLRIRLYNAIKNNYKVGSAIKDLGCSVAELKLYLEKQFIDGMTWDNHGKWHIDHKIPLKSFDLTDRNQFLKAVHYSNLQPLWEFDNLSKGGKLLNYNIA